MVIKCWYIQWFITMILLVLVIIAMVYSCIFPYVIVVLTYPIWTKAGDWNRQNADVEAPRISWPQLRGIYYLGPPRSRGVRVGKLSFRGIFGGFEFSGHWVNHWLYNGYIMLIFGNPAKIEKVNLRLFPTTIRRRHGDLKPKKSFGW